MKKTKEDLKVVIENYEDFEGYDNLLNNKDIIMGGNDYIISWLYDSIDDVMDIANERIEDIRIHEGDMDFDESKELYERIDKINTLNSLKLYLKHTKELIITNKE